MVTQITVNKASPQPGTPQPPFQSQQSFVQRLIDVQITLAANSQSGQPSTFAGITGDSSNSVTLSGYRTSVRIESSGAPVETAQVAIYGLPPSLMNQLSTLGIVYNLIAYNSIVVSAGDAQSGMTPVFNGNIQYAFGDYAGMPDVPFRLLCQGCPPRVVSPTSVDGVADVATLISGLAHKSQLGFENNGITVKLSNPYYAGDLWTQIQNIARDANIYVGKFGNVVAIWPKGGSRTSQSGGNAAPLVSSTTGLVGYPTFSPNGLMFVKMLFNPQVSWGSTIQVESSLPQANRTWVVQKLDLALDSLVPKGQWMATAQCYPFGFAAPAPS